jgi:hypothetical protein
MVTITPTMTVTPHGDPVVSWTGIASADTAAGWEIDRRQGQHFAVQISGESFSNGTVTLEGSNDGENWFTLKDKGLNDISTNSDGIFEVTSSVRYIRPDKSGGSGDGSVDVTIIFRGA